MTSPVRIFSAYGVRKGLLTATLLLASVMGMAGRVEAVPLLAVDLGFVTEVGGSAKGDGTLAPGATYNYSAGREEHYAGGFLSPPCTCRWTAATTSCSTPAGSAEPW